MKILKYFFKSTSENWSKTLRNKIIAKKHLNTFDECVRCYNSNNFRAGYILTWTLLCESLKEKVFLAADQGEKNAIIYSKQIESSEKHKKSVDNIVIEAAKNLAFIEYLSFSDIDFFWSKRCIFAHPYNVQPSADELRHIIERTVILSLSQELRYKKPYLESLISNIINKPHFLPLKESDLKSYFDSIIPRIDETLLPFLFKNLMYELESLIDKTNSSINSNTIFKIRIFIIQILNNTNSSLESDEWRIESYATANPLNCFVGFVHELIWPKLSDRVCQILIQFSTAYLLNTPIIGSPIAKLNDIEKFGLLSLEQKRELKNAINEKDFITSLDLNLPFEIKIKKAITVLRMNQFREISNVINFLKGISFEDLNTLKNFIQIELGWSIILAARGNSWDTIDFVKNIPQKQFPITVSFLFGLISGCIFGNSNRSFYYNRVFGDIILSLAIKTDFSNTLYKLLFKYIKFVDIRYSNDIANVRIKSVNHLLKCLKSEELVYRSSTIPIDNFRIFLSNRNMNPS
ncbi:hypothetical protein [Leptospira borgpetersenii]|uniref:hypothetical protein n=1 Tax=Leptospira borgpetersenii TaxID=174 RepID=UPI000773599C|nr:hypothetical protein [Leptospira borgpetersenii]